jgi:hypothetical protein
VNDKDSRIVAAALQFIVASDTLNPPYTLFIEKLADRDPGVRAAALRGLQRRASPADLEPLLRDSVVLALPFQPLCQDDCPGLCVECGARLADDPGHQHEEAVDPRWAALQELTPRDTDGRSSGPEEE